MNFPGGKWLLLSFTPCDGFLLNGKRVEIRGVCNHHDLGALGFLVQVEAFDTWRKSFHLPDPLCIEELIVALVIKILQPGFKFKLIAIVKSSCWGIMLKS